MANGNTAKCKHSRVPSRSPCACAGEMRAWRGRGVKVHCRLGASDTCHYRQCLLAHEPMCNLIYVVVVDPPPLLAHAIVVRRPSSVVTALTTPPRRRDKWLDVSVLTVRGMNDPPSVGLRFCGFMSERARFRTLRRFLTRKREILLMSQQLTLDFK